MWRLRRLLLAIGVGTLLLLAVGPPTPAVAGLPHPMFVRFHPEVRNNKWRLLQLLMADLRHPQATVGSFNRNFGKRLGYHANTLQDLVKFLQNDRFRMVKCPLGSPVRNYGWSDTGVLVEVNRQCYKGEWMLVDTMTHLSLFSGYCGNEMVAPPPPPRPIRVLKSCTSWTSKAGFAVIFGARDTQRGRCSRNEIYPIFKRLDGPSGWIPPLD